MAKISARGATEVARWKGDGGAELVLTSDGRLLRKAFAGEGWKVLAGVGRSDLAHAEAFARRWGYSR
jgi:hypothetical protein